MLVAGVILAVVLLSGEDPPPEVVLPTPGETTQETASNPTLDQLLAYMPPEVSNCIEATAAGDYGAAIESVLCQSNADPRAEVTFFLYPSPEAAAGAYQTINQNENQTPDSGDCAAGQGGETAWSGGGGSGRLSCGLSGELAAVLWSSDGYPVLGQVTATTPEVTIQEVYNIWLGISDYSV